MRTLRSSLVGMVIVALLGGLGGVVLAQADDHEVRSPVTVTFYHTADIHEHAERLPRIAGFVESRRDVDPNVLFVDSGDWFNGGELADLGTRGEAITAMLGAMGYDALVFGNHDYSFGTPRLAELIDRFALPVVAANVRWPADIEPEQAEPYRIFELEGVTVAVVGVAIDFIGPAYAMQEADELMEFLPIDESIGDTVAMLDERADIIVLLTHLGMGEDRQLAEAMPGIDMIFGGHDHALTDQVFIPVGTDTIIQHSSQDGLMIGELTVGWDGERIVEPEVRLVWVADDLPTSVAVEEIHQEYLSQAPPLAE